MPKIKGYVLALTAEEFEQITCDLEGARDELQDLSHEIPEFCTLYPERLDIVLELIHKAVRQ